MSRGLTEEQANVMIVNGFIEPITKELPLEYAVELNRLIETEINRKHRLSDAPPPCEPPAIG